MARKRMEEPAIKSWEEADAVLKQIRDAEMELAAITMDMEKCINDIKENAEKEAGPLKDEVKILGLQLKEFTTFNKSELKGKSRELSFGTVGFRASTSLVLPKAAEGVIRTLKKLGMGDCINLTETVNKEVLKTYDEKTILMVGASLKKKDTFWYETKKEELAETT